MGLDISLRYLLSESGKVDEMGSYAAPEHFEFISSAELQSDFCPADDIFVSGKLVPLMTHQTMSRTFPIVQLDGSPIAYRERKNVHRKRSESSSEHKPTFPPNSIKRKVVRNNSWKSDGSSVSSNSSVVPDVDRNYSFKSDGTSFASPKIRWQSLIYGMGVVKFPVEMELRDIKHRQSRRRRPGLLFPTTQDSECRGRGTSWGLIKALSCKDHKCTSVNASLVFMPAGVGSQ